MKTYFSVAVVASCFGASCCTAIAADPTTDWTGPGTIYHSTLLVVVVLLGLTVSLIAARSMYDRYKRRRAIRAAGREVKERIARGQKPYC
ncbi:hypothetical protein QEL91_004129 [Pseudomonas putida]|nr:hypothetical protein [Pseudomonas putida]